MKKVYIGLTGTHSTGKTTLIKPLISILGSGIYKDVETPIIPITGISRLVQSRYNIQINESGGVAAQTKIEQLYGDMEFMYTAYSKIADRTVVDRAAYARYGKLPPEVQHSLYDASLRKAAEHYSHIFYLPPEIPLIEDGVRSTDKKFRDEVDKHIQDILREYNIPFTTITGTVDVRISKILSVIGKSK